MVGVMVAVKGLPSYYNKDFKKGWEPMLDSVQTVSDSPGIAHRVISISKVRTDRIGAALYKTMLNHRWCRVVGEEKISVQRGSSHFRTRRRAV
ncbi:hypothetical protein LX32DRAFT_284313 [Colletotrichum zoysiae]|uniref:Uncharacterized protein n=1 Tax=Colletotrichum zoysiae TaxID=1216348 RepID=A0AAD9M339_9PEZI|nr:hypothetical protein LX32DRAFT_284313 [Colletotrichum zoysiae]